MQNSRFAIAVHILALMANYKDELLKSDFVACFVKTNPVVIRRSLPVLARAGLIETLPGASGGSRLKRSAAQISLWEIYQAVETSAAFTVHQPATDEECIISRNIECVLIGIQNRVDKAVWQTLRDISLSDVLRMLKDENGGAINDGKCRELQEADTENL